MSSKTEASVTNATTDAAPAVASALSKKDAEIAALKAEASFASSAITANWIYLGL